MLGPNWKGRNDLSPNQREVGESRRRNMRRRPEHGKREYRILVKES